MGVGDRPGGRARRGRARLTPPSRPMDPTVRHELLRPFPVVTETPVAWADMDVFRHVNNTVFFRFFEIARIAYLERIDFDSEERQDGIGPILHSTACRFRRPVTYPDRVLTGARTVEVREDRFTMEYRVVSETLGAVAAEGSAVVVAYDYRRGAKARLPAPVRALLARVEG